MNKHTPTPWEVGNGTEIYCHENGDWVCEVTGMGAQRRRDDAEHIVRCVNSHDALVKALADMVELRDLTMASRVNPDKPELQVVEAARAALAAAGAPQ